MKPNFADAIKKALDKTTADEAVTADIEALNARLQASAARTAPEGKAPAKVSATDEQVAALARSAIQAHGLLGIIEDAIVAEVVSAAKAAPAKEPAPAAK